ncbi:hypothetical protein T01_2259 [Trichinella spiralis]|uniref:PiggyBac transposable element-derived protein domain-containing protein n=1 Tax=Trichinella spiralis TaxID=6334 RepID=A0A0V1B982_TRISP|nr:hypothetical protein T01_2259 [Trichinella spiralis]
MPYDFLFYVLCRPKVEKNVGFIPADFSMKLCEHLPKQQNHRLSSDNYFNFIEFQPRIKEQEQALKDSGQLTTNFRTTMARDIIAVAWYDNRRVTSLTSIYLSFLTSKTEAKAIFFWVIATAPTNGWLLYRREYELFSGPKTDRMDLLAFMTSISKLLCLTNKALTPREGRRSETVLYKKHLNQAHQLEQDQDRQLCMMHRKLR